MKMNECFHAILNPKKEKCSTMQYIIIFLFKVFECLSHSPGTTVQKHRPGWRDFPPLDIHHAGFSTDFLPTTLHKDQQQCCWFMNPPDPPTKPLKNNTLPFYCISLHCSFCKRKYTKYHMYIKKKHDHRLHQLRHFDVPTVAFPFLPLNSNHQWQ